MDEEIKIPINKNNLSRRRQWILFWVILAILLLVPLFMVSHETIIYNADITK